MQRAEVVLKRFFTFPLESGYGWRGSSIWSPPSLCGLLGILPSSSPAPFLLFFLMMRVFIWFSLERLVEVLVFEILLDKGKCSLPDQLQSETLTEQIHLPLRNTACYPGLQETGSWRGVGRVPPWSRKQVREDATKGFNCKFSKLVLKHNFNNESTLLPIYRIIWMAYFCDLQSFFFAF